MMDTSTKDHISILTALSEGIDPFTGEVLPNDHLLQNPQVIRSIFHAISALERNVKKRLKFSALEKAGEPWDKQEDEELIQQFDSSLTIQEIAILHRRSRGAITSRLKRLGKLLSI
jgi:hypothetical protein